MQGNFLGPYADYGEHTRMKIRDLAVALATCAGIATAARIAGAEAPTSIPLCTGDCDASAAVTVDEILVGVNIALGQQAVTMCRAFDRDGSDDLTVDELVSGVDAALNGCILEEAEGPFITAMTLVRADDIVLDAVDVDALGRKIFVRPFGSGFSMIVETRPGPDGADVGHQVFEEAPDLPTLRPDIQIIVSSNLGDGSAAVCDDESEPQGGVPAAQPFGFQEQVRVSNVINEMSCRIDGGARTNDVDACTLSRRGNDFGYAFFDRSSKVQFCLPIARTWAFPVWDTVIAARARDILGNVGEIHEIIVRIPEAPP